MDETQGIVPAQTPTARKPPRPARPWLELALCVAGSFGSLFLPAVGTFAMVFGLWLLSRSKERRVWAGVAGCVLPGVVLSAVSWIYYGSLVVPCIACALVVALLLPGRIGITSVCLTIVGLTGAMVMADASILMLQGESFAAYVSALLDEMRELTVASLGGTVPVAVEASIDQTLEFLGKTWPLIYALRAAGVVVLGLFGLMLSRRDTYQSVYAAFTRYDMPLWGVVALAAAIACLAYGAFGPRWADAVEAAGLNVLMFLRAAFFLQGLAVAMSLMDRRRWGPVPRVLVIMLMLMAELGFYAVCVFGVIDVWANFRRLERRHGGPRTAEAHGESE